MSSWGSFCDFFLFWFWFFIFSLFLLDSRLSFWSFARGMCGGSFIFGLLKKLWKAFEDRSRRNWRGQIRHKGCRAAVKSFLGAFHEQIWSRIWSSSYNAGWLLPSSGNVVKSGTWSREWLLQGFWRGMDCGFRIIVRNTSFIQGGSLSCCDAMAVSELDSLFFCCIDLLSDEEL